jgi:hypothetical protein
MKIKLNVVGREGVGRFRRLGILVNPGEWLLCSRPLLGRQRAFRLLIQIGKCRPGQAPSMVFLGEQDVLIRRILLCPEMLMRGSLLCPEMLPVEGTHFRFRGGTPDTWGRQRTLGGRAHFRDFMVGFPEGGEEFHVFFVCSVCLSVGVAMRRRSLVGIQRQCRCCLEISKHAALMCP